MKVKIKFSKESLYYKNGVRQVTLRNITEIHYNYPSPIASSIAFENEINGTGCTYKLSDIKEFEAKPK